MLSSKSSKIYLLIVLLLLVLPLILANYKPDQISEIDNRKLTEFPAISYTEMKKNLPAYVEDRIGFRQDMIKAYTLLNDRLFHVMAHPTYQYGQNDYVFFKQTGKFLHDYDFMDDFANLVEKVYHYCNERNVPFIYMLMPGKTLIYEEYLPKGLIYDNSRIDYLKAKLEEKQIPYLDAAESLFEAKKDNPVFNVQYDAGHWNDHGAYAASEALFRKINELYPEVKFVTREHYQVEEVLKETLPVSYFPIHEYVPEYKHLTEKAPINDRPDYMGMKIGPYNYFYRVLNPDLEHQHQALVFHGSYYNGRDYFLDHSFAEYTAVHNYFNIFDLPYYFQLFQPDLVVLTSADYAMITNYFPQDRLKEVAYNPVWTEASKGKEIERSTEPAYYQVLNANNKMNDWLIQTSGREPGDYAYIKIGDQVFDTIWDQEKEGYRLALKADMNLDLETGMALLIVSAEKNVIVSKELSVKR